MSKSPSRKEELIRQLQRHYIAENLLPDRIKALAELLSQLDHVSESGEGWSARCPSHVDSRPSLSIGVNRDGSFLLYCHRDCSFEDIVREAGMLPSEMFYTAPSTRSAIQPPHRPRNIVPEATAADPSWNQRHALFQKHAIDQCLEQLASHLSVTVESLRSIEVGWCSSEKCWTFPERNGEQKVCGIVRRFRNDQKYAFKGGHRGLTLPLGWDESDAILHICEGASDVAAAISRDMRAIGRPGLKSGFDDLAILLKDEPAEIVMIADNDSEGVGRAGAKHLANRLSNFLKRSIDVMAPPEQYKDLREHLTNAKI